MQIIARRARARRTRVWLAALLILAAGSVTLALTAGSPAAPARAATTSSASSPPPPLTWSGPVQLAKAPYQDANPLGSISCPSARFCIAEAAVVGGEGVLTSTDPAGGPSAWSAPRLALPDSNPETADLSCPTSTFCAQLAGSWVYTSTAPGSGKHWTRTSLNSPDGSYYGLSCPSAKLCVATGAAGQILTSTDPGARHPSWHLIIKRGFGRIDAVSCPAVSFCAAVTLDGDVLTSSHPAGKLSAWKVTDADGSVPLTSLSCPSARFCIAADSASRFVYSADPAGGASRWHAETEPFGGSLTALTCTSAAFCLSLFGAGSNGGEADLAWSTNPAGGPSQWSMTSLRQYSPAAISCASSSFCAISGTAGYVLTSSDPASSTPTWTPADIDGYTELEDIDCRTTSLCVAADTDGHLFTSTDPTGGPGRWHSSGITASSITCPTTTFCAALGSAGLEVSDNPAGGASAWQQVSAPSGLNLLSCPSASLCVASGSDSSGDTLVYTSTDPAGGASSWQEANLGSNSGGEATSLTCPTVNLCVGAVGNSVLTSKDPAGGSAAWHFTSLSPLNLAGVGGFTCPSASLCMGFGDSGDPDYFTFVVSSTDPAGGIGAWHVNRDDLSNPFLIDCPATTECYQVTDGSGMATSTNPTAATPSWLVSPGNTRLTSISCPATSLCVGTTFPGGTNPSGYRGGIQTGTPPHPGASLARLKVSATRLTYGRETREHLTATVGPRYPQYTAVPAGRIVIASSKQTLCRLALRRGRAYCTLKSKQLAPGKYWLRIRYAGDRAYAASQSALIRVTVVR